MPIKSGFLFDFHWSHPCTSPFSKHLLCNFNAVQGHSVNRKPTGGFLFDLHCHQHCISHCIQDRSHITPLFWPNRQHQSCDDCLEDNKKDYQNCSVLYCVCLPVPQSCIVISTVIRAVLTGELWLGGLGFCQLILWSVLSVSALSCSEFICQ